MRELELQQKVIKFLSDSGLVFWRQSLGGVLQHTGRDQIVLKQNPMIGFPDLAGVTPDGQFWALELKSPRGKLSIQQEFWQRKLTRSGALVGVARSFEEAIMFIESLKARSRVLAS